jgi:hypothetical protein
MRKAIDIIEYQASEGMRGSSRLWLKALKRRRVGREVQNMVDDVTRLESSGKARQTTWAKDNTKREKERVDNMMGYQLRVSHNSQSHDEATH